MRYHPNEKHRDVHKPKQPSLRLHFLHPHSPGCFQISTVFSHSRTVVMCESCGSVICTPTGGKAKLTEGVSFRVKN